MDNEELLKNNKFYVQAGYVSGEIYTQHGKYKIEIQSDAVNLFSYRYKTGSGYERNSKLIMNMNTDNFSLDREFDYSDKLDQLYLMERIFIWNRIPNILLRSLFIVKAIRMRIANIKQAV